MFMVYYYDCYNEKCDMSARSAASGRSKRPGQNVDAGWLQQTFIRTHCFAFFVRVPACARHSVGLCSRIKRALAR